MRSLTWEHLCKDTSSEELCPTQNHSSPHLSSSIHEPLAPSAPFSSVHFWPPVPTHLPPGLQPPPLSHQSAPCCLFDYPHFCSSHYCSPEVRGCLAVHGHSTPVGGWLHSQTKKAPAAVAAPLPLPPLVSRQLTPSLRWNFDRL